MCQSRPNRSKKTRLFDHVVGADKQCRWQVASERLGSFEIDDELQFGRKLDWEVGDGGALQYLVNISRGATEAVVKIDSIANEAACPPCTVIANTVGRRVAAAL